MGQHGLVAADVLYDHAKLGLVSAELSTFRTHGFDAVPDPDGVDVNRPHPCDPAHGAIVEPAVDSKSALKKAAAKLAKDERLRIDVEPQ